MAKSITESMVAIALAAGSALISSTLISGMAGAASAQEQPARRSWQHPTLIAQQLVDGLPPPPFTPNDLSNFPAPPRTGSSSEIGRELYMVYVNGSSPLMLEQVRQVQPDALIQEYQGQPIILVGAYDRAELAEQQVSALADQGISATTAAVPNLVFEPQVSGDESFSALPDLPPAAENTSVDPTLPGATLPPAVQSSVSQPPNALPTAPVSAAPPRREIEFNPVPRSTPASPTPSDLPASNPPSSATARVEPDDGDHSYYIVVPGASDDLPLMQEQILMLGARQDAVSQRQQPLGPHILVGPFVDRQAASRWNRFLREFGMNARVYYRR